MHPGLRSMSHPAPLSNLVLPTVFVSETGVWPIHATKGNAPETLESWEYLAEALSTLVRRQAGLQVI